MINWYNLHIASLYDDAWRSTIEYYGGKNPFPFHRSFGFNGDGRIYFPFEISQFQATDPQDIEVIESLAEAGYSLVDYRKGLVLDAYGRERKIGKIINQIIK